MANILFLVDHDGSKVAKTPGELATFAKRAGSVIGVILANNGAGDALAAQLSGTEIDRLIVVENDEISKHGIAAAVSALAQVVAKEKPEAILVASSARGKEIAGRLALRIAGGVITDATDFRSD
ncbi:MAG: electron transfer flavoprotein subunit alpha/FixB family protein, partial [Actinomycetota bacterium]